MMQLYGIVGAGGFGREVMPLADIMLNAQFDYSDYELVFVTEKKSSDLVDIDLEVLLNTQAELKKHSTRLEEQIEATKDILNLNLENNACLQINFGPQGRWYLEKH